MIFQDNVLKSYLKNVYFVSGTPCGGKTTVSRELSRRFSIPAYDIDAAFPAHLSRSDKALQPNMNKSFSGPDEFFGRTVEEYMEWLKGTTREQLDFVLLDLIKLSQYGKIICDCHITPEQAGNLSDPSRTVFMLREPVNIVDEYCARPDHDDFRRYLYSASDPEKAKAVCNETLYRLNTDFYGGVKNSGWFFIDRAEGLTVESAVDRVAAHFGLSERKEVTVEKVEKGSPRAAELLSFVENCSWEETKEHIAGMIRSWSFSENEAVFAAVSDGRIVGMTTLGNTDYYPLPEIRPWVSCIFVSEEYRGSGISGRMIAAANAYARCLGYERTYIPSPYLGLYERFGYRYVKDIVNYGGDTDHLFVKELD